VLPQQKPAALTRLRRRGGALRDDARRAAQGGLRAPRLWERLWVAPHAVTRSLIDPIDDHPWHVYKAGDWDQRTKPIEEVEHVRFCLSHWRDGLTWEETGAYSYALQQIAERSGRHQDMTSIDDVVERYRLLDLLFDEISQTQRFKTSPQLNPRVIRERRGIQMHVGREGEPIFHGWGGCHRLGLAMCAEIDVIPVMVCIVHAEAGPGWRKKARNFERSRERTQ